MLASVQHGMLASVQHGAQAPALAPTAASPLPYLSLWSKPRDPWESLPVHAVDPCPASWSLPAPTTPRSQTVLHSLGQSLLPAGACSPPQGWRSPLSPAPCSALHMQGQDTTVDLQWLLLLLPGAGFLLMQEKLSFSAAGTKLIWVWLTLEKLPSSDRFYLQPLTAT